MTDQQVDEYVRDVQMASLVIGLPASPETVVASDPQDDPIVATAVRAQAQVLCTRDRHLRSPSVLGYCASHGIEVLSDLELLERFRVGNT